MTSELSKYLNEQLGVFSNAKKQKKIEVTWKHKKSFLSKSFLYNVTFY